MVEGTIYRYPSRIARRDLPKIFGKWQNLWTWHRRRAAEGTWGALHAAFTTHSAKNNKVDLTVSSDSRPPPATIISCVTIGLGELHESVG